MSVITSNSIHDFCRVCLQTSGPLFSCQTKMVFNEVCLTINEILKRLTPQNVSGLFIVHCVIYIHITYIYG